MSLLVVGALLACAIAPRRNVVAAQAFLAAVASLAVLSFAMPDPSEALVPCILLTVLFVAGHPRRRALPRWHGGRHHSMLRVVTAAVATPFLLRNAWLNLGLQLANVAEHATLGHWAGAAALAIALLLVGWLAAGDGPGARPLAVVLGVTWLYLGVAALVLRAYDGSWKLSGAIVALVTGGLFLASTFTAERSVRGDAR